MRIAATIGCILFCSPLCAQSREIDSLRQCVEQQKDTLRITSMIRLGQKLRGSKPEEAEALLQEARAQSSQMVYFKGEVNSLNSLGILYGMRGDYPTALSNFRQALEINRQHNHKTGIANSYSNIGIIYKRIGNYPSSLLHYRQALEIYDELGDPQGRAVVYQNMAVLHDLMGEMEESYELYKKAYALEDSLGNVRGLAIVTGNIGIYHLGKKDYAKADEHFHRYLALARKMQNNNFISDALLNLGTSKLRQGDLTAAAGFLNESVSIAGQMSDQQNQSAGYYSLGEVTLARGDFAAAREFGLKSLQLADSLNSYQLLANSHRLLSDVYERSRDYPRSLEHLRSHIQFKDSLFNTEKVRQFKAQQVQFQVAEKDNALASQRSEMLLLSREISWKQRWLILLTALIGAMTLVLILVIIQHRQRKKSNDILTIKNQKIREQNKEIALLNADLEKRMLRAQMNPHFIFNALSSIQHFITLNDKPSALKYLSRFSHLLRQVLETSMGVNVLLSEEINLLKIYLELESLRFQDHFSYEIAVDEKLDPSQHEVPVLLFQPFVENAILHGLVPKADDRTLMIHFSDADHQIVCTITDNGIGREASSERNRNKTHQPSRGMSVTAQRLAMLEKNRDVKTSITIHDLVDAAGIPAGTQVEIIIPKS